MYLAVNQRFVQAVNFLIDNRYLRNQAELGRKFNLTRGYISQIMNGTKEPSQAIVTKLINEYSIINKNWLLTGEGNMIQSANNFGGDIIQQNGGNGNIGKVVGGNTNTSTTNYYSDCQDCQDKEREERGEIRSDNTINRLVEEIHNQQEIHAKLIEMLAEKDAQIRMLLDKMK